MKTLKIEIPSGFEIDNFDIKTGEIKFKETPKDIKEIIKNFADVLKHHRISEEEFEDQIENLERDEIAYRQVKLIVAALNEGWLPDWTNSSEYKCFPWFKMGSSSGSGFSYDDCDGWSTGSIVGSRLCFKSAELARYIGEAFIDLYRDYFVLNQ